MERFLLKVGLLALLAGCDAGAKITGTTSDGETFTGTAVATGYWDASGIVNLVSNRGLTCVGTYAYNGTGSNGRATFTCNNGEIGTVQLNGSASVGEGTLGNRQITVRWGSTKA